ncbi:MAG: hydrogenase maturation protease [Candidatus Marinimicrobia bacterium]|nr:hydrogenase maturation protease [Candidatus Neomarinimicrobiota bacterium]
MNFKELFSIIENGGYKKILIIGIGNELRGDDRAGLILAEKVFENLSIFIPTIKKIIAGTNPENYIEKMIKFSPELIIIFDSSDFGAEPGTVQLFRREDISNNSISTHAYSIGIIEDYIKRSINSDVFYVLIQKKNTEFGRKISREVLKGIEEF